MAEFKETAQKYFSKAKGKLNEAGETARLNLQIREAQSAIREEHTRIGKYLSENPALLPQGDAYLDACMKNLTEKQEQIAQAAQKLSQLHTESAAPADTEPATAEPADTEPTTAETTAAEPAAAEATEAPQSAAEEPTPAPAAPIRFCPQCGSAVEEGALFCGNCGKKLAE